MLMSCNSLIEAALKMDVCSCTEFIVSAPWDGCSRHEPFYQDIESHIFIGITVCDTHTCMVNLCVWCVHVAKSSYTVII